MIIRKFGKYTGVHPDVIEALAQRAGAVWTRGRVSQNAFSQAVIECGFEQVSLREAFRKRIQTLIHCPIQERNGVLSVPCLADTKLEIPERVREKIVKNCYFGISGDRRQQIETTVLHALSDVIWSIRAISRVHVGDCSGIDRAARRLLYLQNVSLAHFSRVKVKVHRVANKHNKREFVARSIRCIKAVGKHGLWLSFPQSPCPDEIVPTRKWIGGGKSGTWASLALAAGLGLDCLVFSPVHFPTAGEWAKFHHYGDGWYTNTFR